MPMAVGFVTAAAVGVGALALLVPVVRSGRFHYFAIYLMPAGILGLIFLGDNG